MPEPIHYVRLSGLYLAPLVRRPAARGACKGESGAGGGDSQHPSKSHDLRGVTCAAARKKSCLDLRVMTLI